MTGTAPTEDWWTSQQVHLFEDRQRTWRRADFAPSDMLLFRRGDGQGSVGRRLVSGEVLPSDAEIVKGGWDHEHCELCWREIAAEADNQSAGYTDGKGWLYPESFEHYIAPRLHR